MKTDFETAVDILSEPHYTYASMEGELYNDAPFEDNDFEYHTGVSKVVIVLEDCVVKTAFSGYVEEYDENDEPYEDPYFDDFAGDDCKTEYNVYLRAVEAGLGDLFAKIEPTYATGVYKQEKCIITLSDYFSGYYDEDEIPYTIKGSERFKKGGLALYCEENGLEELGKRTRLSYTLAALIDNFDADTLYRLQDFLVRYDINDLHGSNAGIFEGGVIKLFDYCGYESETGSLAKSES